MIWTFRVGLHTYRYIKVEAETKQAAQEKARERLDAIAERKGGKPPFNWQLTWIRPIAPFIRTVRTDKLGRTSTTWKKDENDDNK